jgi:hypothetical protein
MDPDLQPGFAHAYASVCVRRCRRKGIDGGWGRDRGKEKVSKSEPYPSGSRPILAQGGKPPTMPPRISGRP